VREGERMRGRKGRKEIRTEREQDLGTRLERRTHLVHSHQIREILLMKVIVPVPGSTFPNRWWFPLEVLGDHSPYFRW
jgi:hypothetical protein